ncbi:MAG: SAM hydrolase/SAM-dependent halogenase family protein [Planctomycetota bacterium]|jgi:S-adenosylmethionine hydrolase
MIVLLTDFGQSEYVGVMKGVIYSIAPRAKIVDLCHTVAAQSVIEASWVLKNNYKYFPEGATFCCVVDPGVGTERKAIAVRTDNYCFVGPDNGLLWETVSLQEQVDVREIAVPADASSTFHGRDVFAKAAAIIESGNFDKVGRPIEAIVKLELYREGRKGVVVRIDSFGNVITNLEKLKKDKYTVLAGKNKYTMSYFPNYDAAREADLFLIEGSSNSLEISLKNGSANDELNLRPGAEIEIS